MNARLFGLLAVLAAACSSDTTGGGDQDAAIVTDMADVAQVADLPDTGSDLRLDEELIPLVVMPTHLQVNENGGSGSLTVALAGQPSTATTVSVTSSDPGEAATMPALLTFTPDDWDVPRTVTVRGVDDDCFDSTSTISIELAGALVDPAEVMVDLQRVSRSTV